MSLSNIIRADIQQMTAYAVAATPPGFIKLDAMELPYRLPETFRQALGKCVGIAGLCDNRTRLG